MATWYQPIVIFHYILDNVHNPGKNLKSINLIQKLIQYVRGLKKA